MSSSTDIPLLPSYSPSVPAPDYSFEPQCNEQVLQHSPRPMLCPLATGTFIHKNGKVTVVLDHQEDNAQRPVYGQSGRISGMVCLDEHTAISGVTLTIEGRTDATASEIGALRHRIIRDYYVLWSYDRSTPNSYPCHVPFSVTLPQYFQYQDSDYALPPSFHASFPCTPSLLVRTSYWLTIKVTGIRNRHLGFLTESKSINIPFDYYPRVRPHSPIISDPSVYSSVRAMPQEWYQSTSVLNARTGSSVYSHLFVPRGRVYGLIDTIPFHVQVTGPVSPLREVMNVPQSDLNRITPTDTLLLTRRLTNGSSPEPYSPIRVYLLRQVCIQTRGEKAWRNQILGEGKMWSVSPAVSCLPSEESLDWQGEVKVANPTKVGGFDVGSIMVKDFIVLSISPLRTSSSQLPDTQQAVAIRLVTDSWVDPTSPEERGLTHSLIRQNS